MNMFIVAEISKNWETGVRDRDPQFIQSQFEHVIAVNLERGYKLQSFQLHRLMITPDVMNETIIAVFEMFAFVIDGKQHDLPKLGAK